MIFYFHSVIENYCSEPPLDDGQSTFQYWKHKSESIDPMERCLAQVAQIYLTPTATSADIERLFSTAGDIFTNEHKLETFKLVYITLIPKYFFTVKNTFTI